MAYAFLIDDQRCIGCHACSVACKTEHAVPLGVARTWVKQVERGRFPEARAAFTVNRCNHCADAPCVAICPTAALFQRDDGIVDFDSRRCIGCKGCLQGCPYDALYIDPVTETAAKCNYCPHRLDAGLEPPCVTVCPTQAIVSGDLDDPTTTLAQRVGREALQVRKPEKGTRPRLFYASADAASLVPLMAPPASDYVCSDAPQRITLLPPPIDARGAPRRAYGVREQHRHSWGWRVSGYVWTKSIAAGAYLVPALHWLRDPWSPPAGASLLLAFAFLMLTALLLITDLRQPQRFWWTLTRPQWGSWLVRGAYLLAAYAALLWVELLARVAGAAPRREVAALGALLAVGSAVYTAFLFGQAKGRDLWQSPLLAPHLLVQALLAGAAVSRPGWLAGLIPLNGLLVAAEVWGPHATEDASQAARLIQSDPRFTAGVLVLGHVLPLTLLWGLRGAAPMAASLALLGLLIWDHLYVQAPQRIPLS